MRKLLDDRDVCTIQVSVEKYEAAVSSVVAQNHCNPQDGDSLMPECNPQDGDVEFLRDDDYMRAAISDVSPCYDEVLFNRSVRERASMSKLAMESGCPTVEDVTKDDSIFELCATKTSILRGERLNT